MGAQGGVPGRAGDVQLLGGVWTRVGLTLQNRDDVGDDLNLVIELLLSHILKPSRWSERALKDYAKNRPVSYGCYLQNYRSNWGVDLTINSKEMACRLDDGIAHGWTPDCPRVLGALRWYFRPETGGNPEGAAIANLECVTSGTLCSHRAAVVSVAVMCVKAPTGSCLLVACFALDILRWLRLVGACPYAAPCTVRARSVAYCFLSSAAGFVPPGLRGGFGAGRSAMVAGDAARGGDEGTGAF